MLSSEGKVADQVNSRSMYKCSDIVVPGQGPKGFYTHGEAVLAPGRRQDTGVSIITLKSVKALPPCCKNTK